jgi:PAS domain S-box-containing protein
MSRTRMLIVEDERLTARNLHRRLDELGYEVTAIAPSGEEAVRAAAETRPDLVLMDIRLSGEMDGVEAAAQIRAQRDIPVIYLTAYTDAATLQRIQATEPFGYLRKPVDDRELRYTIEVALDRHGRERELREHEERQRLTAQILALLNRSDDETDSIRDILVLVKEFTGFEAVGIRLSEGEDFPYYETRGFPADFVAAERYLCARDQAGELIRDSEGNAVLECMCGNVICGRTDPSLAFFTEGGSFWTNGTTALLASTIEQERQARTRNRCNGQGYESVALIPLRSDDQVIGLLQLNDSRQGMFTPDLIDFLEGIGTSVGIAFARRQAAQALRALTVRYEATLAAVPDIIMEVDRDKVYTWGNEAGLRFFGEDVVGREAAFYFEGEQDTYDVVQPLFNGSDDAIYVESWQRRQDGAKRLLGWWCRTLRDAGGDVVGALSTARDISEHRQAEEAVRRSQAELAAIFDSAPVMMVLMDRERRLRKINRPGVASIGHPAEEIIGLRAGEALRCLHALDDPKGCGFGPACETCVVRRSVLDTLETGNSHRQEEARLPLIRKGRRKGGRKGGREERDLLVSTAPVDVSDDRMALVCIDDVTEIKRAEQERERLLAQIQEQAQRTQQIVDTVPEGVLLLDDDARVVLANPLGKRYLAALAGAEVGDTLIHLGDRPLAELLASPPKGLWHEVSADGRSFQVIGRPLESGPEPQGWVLVVRDPAAGYRAAHPAAGAAGGGGATGRRHRPRL